MNAVQSIKWKCAEKESWEMDSLLRALAPAVKARREAREAARKRESGKRRVNAALRRCGIPLRVL